MPFDIERLQAIELGVAELPDRDAIVELVESLVETMVDAHPVPSQTLEQRYRAQVRALRAVMHRLDLTADLPERLLIWLASQPVGASALTVRVSAKELFEPLVTATAVLTEPSPVSEGEASVNTGSHLAPLPQNVVDQDQEPDNDPSALDDHTRANPRQAQHHGPHLLRPVLRWLNRDKIRMVDYIVGGIFVAVISGVLLFLLTQGSSSSGSNSNGAVSLKSSSTSGARVFLAQGGRRGDEYEYAISLNGFPPHSSMMVSCRDGAHPQGFEFFEIATNRTGTASIGATPCYSPEGMDHWVVVDGVGSNHVLWTEPPQPVGGALEEATGSPAHTWTNFQTAGGTEGPLIVPNQAITVACAVPGFTVADGNTWWYRIASSPWNGMYYASADAFYNNGQTSGSLKGTPFVDPRVPKC